MTEEEYFRKNYPVSCYGDKPLSPYWDYFQDGVEFGERQSEKKIEELEQENKVLAQNLEDTEIVNKALEKENAELRAQIKSDEDLPAIAYQQGAESYKKKADVKLTRAKEIIKGFIKWFTDQTESIDWKEIVEDAENFLKEEA